MRQLEPFVNSNNSVNGSYIHCKYVLYRFIFSLYRSWYLFMNIIAKMVDIRGEAMARRRKLF